MSRNGRIAVIVGAIVIAAVAFVALRPSDDDDSDGGSQAQQATPTTAGTTGEPTPPPKPEPKVDRIRVRQGKPVGGVQDLTWEKGDTIRLEVASDEAHEVHVHGYDVSKGVAPGGVARFKIEATLDGIYEIELEDLAVPIAELKVEP